MKPVDIIVPVYDGYDDTKNCLESLVKSHESNQTEFEIIVVNDKSPNQKLIEWLRSFVQSHDITYLENTTNLGFVGTVNLGMKLHTDRNIVLLNSDTIVASDWLDKLSNCVANNLDVATVTPFSNNATICGFPDFCEERAVLPYADAALIHDSLAVNNGSVVDIPTGIGFCMWIQRSFLDKVGYFDEVKFGKGYGEENDFCMRCSSVGGRNLLCTDAFVAHVGGVSFSAQKEARVAQAQKIIDRLHPTYHSLVMNHIKSDPARLFRIEGLVELIHQVKLPKVLLITHQLGGGVDKHIRELEESLKDKAVFMCIKPAENSVFELSLNVTTKDKIQFKLPDDYEQLLALLHYLGVGCVHIHHIMGINPQLYGIAQELGVKTIFTIHDFYLINANPTLTDENGRFAASFEERDSACAKAYQIPFDIKPEQWRENQKTFLSRCDLIISPSHYVADIFKEYFSDVEISVYPHVDYELNYPYIEPEWKYSTAQHKPLKVLVHGAISREKGADLLEKVADMASKKKLQLEFHLLGYAYRPLNKSVITHGPYDDKDVRQKFDEIAPDVLWYPALWPETYSYTLSSALNHSLPVVVPDIGAFVERVKGRPFSWIVPWDSSAEDFVSLFDALSKGGLSRFSLKSGSELTDYERFYLRSYLDLVTVDLEAKIVEKYSFSSLLGASRIEANRGNWRESLLRGLIHLRGMVGVRWVFSIIPYSWQRYCKRLLSSRPIHEIVHKRD